MQIQSNLASTIAMAFDECPSSVADRRYVQNSVDRTTRWLQRCKDKMQELNQREDTINKHQLLFGINQGAIYEDIRIDHAKRISEMGLDGYAVGGLAVGETHEEMYHILDEVVPYLPKEKPTRSSPDGMRHRQIRPLLLQSISLQTIISMSQECTGRDTREEARLCPL